MVEVSKRIAELTPQKRALLERLLTVPARPPFEDIRAEQPATPPAPVSLPLDFGSAGRPDEVKDGWKRFYDAVSAQLNATEFGRFSFFLNYGYVPDGSPELAAVRLPEHYINRNSVKLVLEVVGDCPVKGRRVLDVGCGRGGTVHVLTTFYEPEAVTGLDLSDAAIAFCRRAHTDPRVRFLQGDAEELPVEDRALDVVTNLESSHSYPHIQRFYAAVARVLTPSGYFLYTDVFPGQRWTTNLGLLQQAGFVVERDRDITANVLRSSDQIASHRLGAFDGRNDQGLMHNFLGVPGSEVYEEMRSGRWAYRILKLRKRQ